jgi:hypothetical protein
MGIRSSAKLDSTSTIIRVLIDMYVEIGDHISLQYGGSEAHKKVNTERSDVFIHGPIGKHKELLTSIRRYYSNAFTDRLKQDAMNLLLGYYIPYLHSIPLWELESDYYLHNLHVKAGRGGIHSMRTYERAFGLEWFEEEDNSDLSEVDSSSTPLGARRAKLAKIKKSVRRSSQDDCKNSKVEDVSESWKISRVRRRLKAQNGALSMWWRAAIQNHIKQRMWIQLRKSPSECLVPPRFERIYQPNKLAQFDRFFARSWAVPVRREHSSEQIKGIGEEHEKLERRKSILESNFNYPSNKSEDEKKDGGSLLDLHMKYGNDLPQKSKLNRFVEHHLQRDISFLSSQDIEGNPRRFVGRINESLKPCDEYLKYTSPQSELTNSFKPGRVAEFQKCLHETSMSSDDVEGIRHLAESSHIEKVLRFGTYRGLDQSTSAVEITTVIEEQYNALTSNKANKGVSGMGLVDLELKRRGYHSSGVREAVAMGWERSQIAEAQYAEIVGNANATCRLSDLTTASSLSRYSSFFDDSTYLTELDLIFIRGPQQTGIMAKVVREGSLEKGRFAKKAAQCGIKIQPFDEDCRAKSISLFNQVGNPEVPAGFDQINDDLFARKDNMFMVFNGTGVRAWRGTEPVTKTSTLSDDIQGFDEFSKASSFDALDGTLCPSSQSHYTY